MSKRILLYPGSFDPPTLGHFDVALRGTKLCDHLIIGINEGSDQKSYMFSSEERKKMFLSYFDKNLSIEVISYSGLTVRFAEKIGAFAILRGLRTYTDFEHEFQMAAMNKHLSKEVETIFIRTGEELAHISSTMVKGIAKVAKVEGMVSNYVESCLVERVNKV